MLVTTTLCVALTMPLTPAPRPAPPRAGIFAMCEEAVDVPDADTVPDAPADAAPVDTPNSSLLPRVKPGSSPMMNTEQKKLPQFYIAGGLAVCGLLLGGVFEDQVGELFGGVREAGGWGDYFGINPPGLAEVRAAKKAAKEERAAARRGEAPATQPAPAGSRQIFP